jgi:hypothetical protein
VTGIETKGAVTGFRRAHGARGIPAAVIVNADANALAAGLLGRDVRRAVAPVARHKRSLSAITWAATVATSGFPLARHNVFFSRDYEREFRELKNGYPSEPTVYVCAQDREGHRTGPERLLLLVNSPANGDHAPRESCGGARHARKLHRLRTLGIGRQKDNHHRSTGFGALFPATGGALYGRASHGWTASFQRPGRQERQYRASIWRGAACIRGRACRWRPFQGGSRRKACWRRGLRCRGSVGRLSLVVPRRVERRRPARPHHHRFRRQRVLALLCAARRKGAADPENHCALNVALYGKGGHRWSMTERGKRSISRDETRFTIGPSAMRWEDGSLVIEIDEVTVPIPGAARGTVRLTPSAICDHVVGLDPEGLHVWRPVAPFSRIEAKFEKPALTWSGTAITTRTGVPCRWKTVSKAGCGRAPPRRKGADHL